MKDEYPVYPLGAAIGVTIATSIFAAIWTYTKWDSVSAKEVIVVWLAVLAAGLISYCVIALQKSLGRRVREESEERARKAPGPTSSR